LFIVWGLGFGVWRLEPPSPTLPPKGEGSLTSIAGVENFQPLQYCFFRVFVPSFQEKVNKVQKATNEKTLTSPKIG